MNTYINRLIALFVLLNLAYPSSSARAMELDESCTISILNRTVQVSAGGGWAMPNILATMRRTRARASCLRGDTTV